MNPSIRILIWPEYPDVEAYPVTMTYNRRDYVHLAFDCPWGCTNRDGTPKRHVHGFHREGEPLAYGGAASHCQQPNALSWYRLVPRKEDAA